MLWITSISFVNHINIKFLNDSEKKVHFGIDNTWGGVGFMRQLTALQSRSD